MSETMMELDSGSVHSHVVELEAWSRSTVLPGVVHRLAVFGGLQAVGPLAWRIYQRYRVAESMQIQYNRARAAVCQGELKLATGAISWMQLSRYQFDAVWDDRKSLTEITGLLPLQALCAAFAANSASSADVADHLLVALVESELLDAEVLTRRILPESSSMASIIGKVDGPEAALSVFAAALVATDPGSTRGDALISTLAADLRLPDALVAALRVGLVGQTQLPMAS